MEKPGMDRRRARLRPGLLGLLALLSLCAPGLDAQEPSGPPAVVVQTSPESPAVGDLWTVTFLVDHPFPSDVQAGILHKGNNNID
ncbi:hypothetical protein FACS1894163_11680 [Spirochaetia bacterium]|nr:hypothetical protein FACS1894163_11680 [Spirochaetia bacterium]